MYQLTVNTSCVRKHIILLKVLKPSNVTIQGPTQPTKNRWKKMARNTFSYHTICFFLHHFFVGCSAMSYEIRRLQNNFYTFSNPIEFGNRKTTVSILKLYMFSYPTLAQPKLAHRKHPILRWGKNDDYGIGDTKQPFPLG